MHSNIVKNEMFWNKFTKEIKELCIKNNLTLTKDNLEKYKQG